MCLGVPGRVTAIRDDNSELRMGSVDFGGVSKEVCLAYVPDAKVGDYVVVHVGFAISIVDEKEAARVFDYLKQISEMESSSKRDGAS